MLNNSRLFYSPLMFVIKNYFNRKKRFLYCFKRRDVYPNIFQTTWLIQTTIKSLRFSTILIFLIFHKTNALSKEPAKHPM